MYSTEDSDYGLEEDLITEIDRIVVKGIRPGSRPMPVILDRPILRCRIPDDASSPWEDKSSVVECPSGKLSILKIKTWKSLIKLVALAAAQELLFGSLKVQTLDTMDEIAIANNISNSANGVIISYNYCWIWKDTANDIKFKDSLLVSFFF